jgi:hypothetical protein
VEIRYSLALLTRLRPVQDAFAKLRAILRRLRAQHRFAVCIDIYKTGTLASIANATVTAETTSDQLNICLVGVASRTLRWGRVLHDCNYGHFQRGQPGLSRKRPVMAALSE